MSASTPILITAGGWDSIKNIAIKVAPSTLPTTLQTTLVVPMTAPGESFDYYVRLTPYPNTTGGPIDGKTLYELKDFDFSIEQTLNIGSQSTGAGAGKVTFNPLSLTLNSSTLLPKLFQVEASGTAIQQIEVLAYKRSVGSMPTLAFDYSFGLAAVKTLAQNDGGAYQVTLEYGSQSIVTFDPSNSTAKPLKQGAWDRVRNVNKFGVDAADPPRTLANQKMDGIGEELVYTVTFKLYSGGVLTVNGQSVFTLQDFEVDTAQTLNIGSQSTGAGAGKITFNPLTLSFKNPDLAAALFKMQAAGTAIKEVDVSGAKAAAPNQPILIDTFKLAAVKTLSVDDSGHDVVSLEYGGFQIRTATVKSDGTISSTSNVAGWNRLRNSNDVSDLGTPLDGGPILSGAQPSAAMTMAAMASAATSGPATHYYVRFTPYSGTTSSLFDGKTLYAIEGFSFDTLQTLNLGSQSTGAGAGKVTFDPLTLTLDQTLLTPALYTSLASGKAFKELDVVGYRDDGSLATEFSFGLAAASEQDFPSGTISFEYGAAALQTFNAGASPSKPTTSSIWNTVKNTSDFATSEQDFSTPQLAPASDKTKTADAPIVLGGSPTLNYYVRFTLPSTVSSPGPFDGTTLYSLLDFNLSDVQTLNIGSQSTGAGAGKVTFNPLELTLANPQLTPKLASLLASGTAFREIDVLGYTVDGKLASQYSFGLAGAKELDITSEGPPVVSFEYGAKTVTTLLNPDLTPAPASATASWNIIRNTASFTDGATAVKPLSVPKTLTDATVDSSGGGTLHWYIRFTPYKADTSGGFSSSTYYEVDAFDVSSIQTLNIGSQSTGTGAGKVTFNPLTVTLAQLGLEPALLTRLASGTAFSQVDLVGFNRTGDALQSYTFGLVAAKSMAVDSSGTTTLSLEYGAEQYSTTTIAASGLKTTQSSTWDRVRNVNDFSDGVTVSHPSTTFDAPTSKNVAPTQDLSSIRYYVRFTPKQQSADFNGQSLYALESFSVAAEQTLNIGAQSTGAGAGKVQFDPLYLSFQQQSISPALLVALSAGTPFQTIDVVGYRPDPAGGPDLLSVDYSFSTAALKTMDTNATGVVTLSLEYGSEYIQTYAVGAAHKAPTALDESGVVRVGAPLTFKGGADFGFADVDKDAFAGLVIVSAPGVGALTLRGVKVSTGQTISASDIAAGALQYQGPTGLAATTDTSFVFAVKDDGGTANGGADTSTQHTYALRVTPADTVGFSLQTAGVYVDLDAGYAYLETTPGVGWTDVTAAQTAPNGYLATYFTGASKVTGSNFSDRLYGTSGDNVFRPLEGSDIVYGQGGSDTVDYSGRAAGVYVDLANRFAYKETAADVGWTNPTVAQSAPNGFTTDTLISVENAVGTDFNDRFYGGAGDNVFSPGAGSDIVYGGGGRDTVDYSSLAAGVFVDLSANFAYKETTPGVGFLNIAAAETAPNGFTTDALGGIANVTGTAFDDRLYGPLAGGATLTGGAGNDLIYARGSGNALYGGDGADQLVAASGDLLTGGAGNDAFIFVKPSNGGATIADFAPGQDVIKVASGNFGTYVTGQSVSLASGVGSSDAIFGAQHSQGFAYDTGSGKLYFDTDGAGGAGATLVATLTGAPSLSANDIVVYS